MENLRHRSGLYGAGQTSRSITAQPSRLSILRRFLHGVWGLNTGGHALTEDCLRCGHPVVDGMYCFHCGYVRPRTTKQRRRQSVFADWFFKAR